MTDLESLFFELIRAAIGTQDSLSRQPSDREWGRLFKMAEKQSLTGICFAGLQNLGADAEEGFAKIGMSELQYLNWMGAAGQIQARNEEVTQQCTELQARLGDMGFRSCILKGQSAAQLYAGGVQMLRNPGDIDVWLDAPRKEIIRMVQNIAPTTNVREHHLELRIFPDTEVEVHFWPAVIRHFLKNRRLQKWFRLKREEVFAQGSPTPEFHAVQMMAHMYHHLFDSGIGLRQVMDYYFVLQALAGSMKETAKIELASAIKHIGMGRFASAMMWVIANVFEPQVLDTWRANHKDIGWMICEPDEEDGRFLMGEIMRGGNFGRHDPKKTRDTSTPLKSFITGLTRNLRYLRFNHFDWFWSPIWRVYYYGWRRINGFK